MKLKQRVHEYTLYRYRFMLGYSFALISVVMLIGAAALFVPQGIRLDEQASALQSSQIEFSEFQPSTVVYLPYHLLQLGSFGLFGVSELSIKLPSVLLGITAVIGMFLLIRAWARSNVAVIAALIGATTPAFIFAAQDGTPMIFSIAASIWLLLAATYIARRHAPGMLWKVLFFVLFVLSMYTPLGIYLCIALVSTLLFHPHIRYVVKRLNPNRIAIGAAIGLVLLSPLLYSVVTEPSVGYELLGIPNQMPDWWAQLTALAGVYLGFGGAAEAGVLRPVISSGVGLIMLVGLYRLWKTRHTARSYVTWLWLILLLPFIYLNPEYALMIIPILVILVAMGIATLIIEWYRLFPLNPYARILGLLPLSIIVIAIVLSSVSRYSMGYLSIPDVARAFNSDLRLLTDGLERAEATTEQPIPVVVDQSQQAFYELAAEYDKRYTITTQAPSEAPFIILTGSGAQPVDGITPNFIGVTHTRDKSDRFYLYKPSQ